MAKKSAKKAAAVQKKQEGSRNICLWILAGIVLFFVICLCADNNIKTLSLVLVVLTLALAALRFGKLRSMLRPCMLALMLLVIMGGVSTFYAQSGMLALQEFLKLLCGFCIALSLVLVFSGREEKYRWSIAAAAEIAVAIAALLSIDLLSTRILSGAVMGILEKLEPYYAGLDGVEAGVRLTSIFRKPNIFAGCAGIGVLLSLGLSVSTDEKGGRRLHLCCLYISSVAFVLAFSMGAVAAIAAAFVVFLLLEDSSRRAGALLTMAGTLVLTAVSVVLISLSCLDRWDGITVLPLVCLAAGCFALCLGREKLAWAEEKLRGRGRLIAGCCAGIVVILLGFVFAAYNLSTAKDFEAGEGLSRSSYPQAGEYSLSLEGGDGLSVEIVSQNSADTMMHTESLLYSGPAQGAKFEVPQDSVVVYFRLRAQQDTRLEKMEYSGDASSGSIRLDYLLLPDFMANRIQGLFANQNAIQRLVFFRDGLKIFARSPIIGQGMGAFENAVQSVQSFHYETKYVHNHYIQLLLETGIVGLAIFLGLLVCCAMAIIRSKRGGNMHPLTPALGGALVFMMIHGGVEVVFSAYCYLPLACIVFLLINQCCDMEIKPMGQKLRRGIAAGMGVVMLVYAVFVGCSMAAGATTRRQVSYRTLESAASMDVFEWESYALSYVMACADDESASAQVRARAAEYAQRLEKGSSNTRFLYLADYYFALDNVEKGMEMALRHAENTISNSNEWNSIFTTLRLHNPSGQGFEQGIEQLFLLMQSWDETNMGSITLTQDNLDYIEKVLG